MWCVFEKRSWARLCWARWVRLDAGAALGCLLVCVSERERWGDGERERSQVRGE